jgi:hypothetical protein
MIGVMVVLRNRLIVRATRRTTACSVASMNLEVASNPAGAIVRTLDYQDVRTLHWKTSMGITASKLRANVYRLLDEVLETGQPLEIERNGKILVIAPKEEQSIWDRLPRREGFIVGDPDELIHMDWSSEWNPDPS